MTGIVVILVLLGIVLSVQARKTAEPDRARTLRRIGLALMIAGLVVALVDVADMVADHGR